MTAEAPAKSPMSPLCQAPNKIPAVGSTEWMRWIQNIHCGERFDSDKPTSSTDLSLQLAASLQNFFNWRNKGSKLTAERYRHNLSSNIDLDFAYEVRRAKE